MHRTVSSLFAVVGLAIVAAAPGGSRAADLTTLVSFCSLANCADGADPEARLVADARGNLFGTTNRGGANGQGTIFAIVNTAESRGHEADRRNLHHPSLPDYASTPTVLYSFCALANCADGATPAGGLTADARGNLFGTTIVGGANNSNRGTVFEIFKTGSSYASTPTTLLSFCALPNCTDGAWPTGGLIADARGNLFGTTQIGGANFAGTVFEIVKTASGYASTATILYNFCSLANCADGNVPSTGVIADAKGNLFGTTIAGGANGRGTVFEIVKTAEGYASTPITLVSFCSLPNCADGAEPGSGLIADGDGNLFGTTFVGGAHGNGTVFEVVNQRRGHEADRRNLHHPSLPDYASAPTILVSFCAQADCADGANPAAALIADAKGNLFGTTTAGGNNGGPTRPEGGGTMFEIVKTASGYASTLTTLVSFCSVTHCADGAEPRAALIADTKGNLFGTTSGAGAGNNGGTVFEITDSGFVVAHKFDGAPGSPNCFGQSVSALAQKFGGLNGAADDLGHPSVRDLQVAIMEFCEG